MSKMIEFADARLAFCQLCLQPSDFLDKQDRLVKAYPVSLGVTSISQEESLHRRRILEQGAHRHDERGDQCHKGERGERPRNDRTPAKCLRTRATLALLAKKGFPSIQCAPPPFGRLSVGNYIKDKLKAKMAQANESVDPLDGKSAVALAEGTGNSCSPASARE
jgi:hypothetical protein